MNPIRDIALWIQPLLPATEGWQAAAVLMSITLNFAIIVAASGLGVWVAIKMGYAE